jgi:hypothetical protein
MLRGRTGKGAGDDFLPERLRYLYIMVTTHVYTEAARERKRAMLRRFSSHTSLAASATAEVTAVWCIGLLMAVLLFGVSTAAAVPTIPDAGSGTGDLATVVYNASATRELTILRGFRDTVLLTNPVGAFLVRTYEDTTPPLAAILAANERLALAVRALLFTPLVYLAAIALNTIALAASLLLVMLLLLLLHRHLHVLLTGVGYGLLVILGGVVLVITLGALGYELPLCAAAGAYLLPFIIPVGVVVCVLTWVRKRDRRGPLPYAF